MVMAMRTARHYAHIATYKQQIYLEVYRSGHNGPHSKCGNGVTRSWVRIPPLPPLVNNTNTETKTGFVLFFSNEYFGIKVDLDGKKKKLPGV